MNMPLQRKSALLDSNNLGQFYRYVNKKMVTKNSIGVLKDKNGENVYDPVGQADIFSSFIASTFTTDDGILPEFPSRVPRMFLYLTYRLIKRAFLPL